MALFIADGFDLISNIAQSEWFIINFVTVNGTTTRFGSGQSVRIDGAGSSFPLYRDNLSISSNTVFFAFALLLNNNSDAAISGRDGGSNQVTIHFQSNGNIAVRTGAANGTIVATFSNAYKPTVWTHFQIEVIIHNTAGEVHIRKNGNTVDDFAATSLNTRGGTSNNYLTGVALMNVNTNAAAYFDDFMMFDNSGASPNTWCGDVRCSVLYPNADTAQADFTSVSRQSDFYTSGSSAHTFSANTLYMTGSVTLLAPTTSGLLQKITLQLAASTGNVNVALYDSAGIVLIATATAVNNPSGWTDFVFASPPAVVAGTTYRFAVLSDATINYVGAVSTASGAGSVARTYGSGFYNAPSISDSVYIPNANFNVIPTRSTSVGESSPNDGDTTYVYSSTIGAKDLYTLQDLSGITTGVTLVQLRVTARKQDAGARSAQSVLVSGANTDLGTSTVLSSSYTQLIKAYPVNPSGANWTASDINNLQVGVTVSA